MTYTNQTAFDKTWQDYVVNRRIPGLNNREGCEYRVDTPEGEGRCAIGNLMTDELIDTIYKNGVSGKWFHELTEWYDPETGTQPFSSLIEGCNHKFLADLQSCHDNSRAMDEDTGKKVFDYSVLEDNLRCLADKWNLEVPS